jgi:hypothetical protein
LDAHIFFIGQHFQKGDSGNGVGVNEGCSGEVDHRGNLVSVAQDARLELLGSKHLQPSQTAAENQQNQPKKGSPEQTHFELARGIA